MVGSVVVEDVMEEKAADAVAEDLMVVWWFYFIKNIHYEKK